MNVGISRKNLVCSRCSRYFPCYARMRAHARVIPGEVVSVNPENGCISYAEIITWLCSKMRVSRAHARMRTWGLGSKKLLHLLQVALFVAMMRESAVAVIFGCVAVFATRVVWLDISRKTELLYVAVLVSISATTCFLAVRWWSAPQSAELLFFNIW